MKIRTLIIEDELPSLKVIKVLLNDFADIEVIGEAQDGQAAIDLINTEKPDLIFLDIELPGLNGLEVLKQIRHQPMVIFTTAYKQYAIDAFDANGIDYILKPIVKDRLTKAINRVLALNKKPDSVVLKAIENIISQKSKKIRFSIKDGDQIHIIPAEQIFFFKSEDKYVFLHTYDKFFFYHDSLKELEKTIDNDVFIRINKSYIVSIERIKHLKKYVLNPREYVAIMDDKKNTSIKVGRNYLTQLKEKLNITF